MKLYATFLGYSLAEGSTQEIFTEDNDFEVGEVDLKEMKPKFSDFEFNIKSSEIYKYNNKVEKDISYLQSNIDSVTTSIKLSSQDYASGDKLWIGAERIQIVSLISGSTYSVIRGVNDSISVYHSSNTTTNANAGNVIVSSKRITPLGGLIKIYKTDNKNNNLKVLGYYFIDEITSKNNNYITLKVKNVYDYLDENVEIEYKSNDYSEMELWNIYAKIGNTGYTGNEIYKNEIYSCEFLKLFNLQLLDKFGFKVKYEVSKSNSKNIVFNMKKIVEEGLKSNNYQLYFDSETGRYDVRKFGRLTSITSINSINIFDYILFNSDYNVELHKKVKAIKFKGLSDISDNENNSKTQENGMVEFSYSDYDLFGFTKDSLELNFEVLKFSSIADVTTMCKNRILEYNSIDEIIEFKQPKWLKNLTLGSVYKLLDSHKLNLFRSTANETVFYVKVISNENDSLKLALFNTPQRYLVAPALIMYVESGSLNTLRFYDMLLSNNIDNYINTNNKTNIKSNLQNAMIDGTLTPIFEVDDHLNCCFNSDNVMYDRIIDTITDDTIVLTASLPQNGFYLVSYPVVTSGSPTNKYAYFLHSDFGVV